MTHSPEILEAHGFAPGEYERILAELGREPNLVELGVFSAMWSEHCSYKSSRKWLAVLPTEGPRVVQGPGENAGAVDIGGGLAAVFKMESHNHPSFIEPRQGAATGVGGILRDVFTMGARPVASLNALRFGAPDHPRTRHLLAGVVEGIGGYGNCVGVPTVGGECEFHGAYDGNILVNAMTVGIAPADRLFRSRAAGVGNAVVYVGAKTGRDGVHGATMASAAFDDGAEARRPTVQVGDPFTGKLLIEACLELMATDAIVAIQDMGAAGLTSSAVEMASKGGIGIELDLDRVPQRERDMSAYEIMLSESQERMLMVLRPGGEAEAGAIFAKWGLDLAVIGRLTGTGRIRLRHGGGIVADLPLGPLADGAPALERDWIPTPPSPPVATRPGAGLDLAGALKALLGGPSGASRRWIWEQHDRTVMGDTLLGPGGDAAVVRVHGTGRALALSSDCTPRYCLADPVEGGRQAVAEAWRNLTSVGALPLAVTDNLNFGSPERPEVMGQFVGCVRGMAEACRALDMPVVSGNVSFYNETAGRAVLPTPVVGAVGLVEEAGRHVGVALPGPGLALLLVGRTEGHIGRSRYLEQVEGREEGPPPPVDLAAERRHGDFVRAQIRAERVAACHDLSDGGLAQALAEMALAGGVGARFAQPLDGDPVGGLFGEDQARYLLASADPEGVLAAAREASVPVARIGETGGDALTVDGFSPISLEELRACHEGWLPALMGAGRE